MINDTSIFATAMQTRHADQGFCICCDGLQCAHSTGVCTIFVELSQNAKDEYVLNIGEADQECCEK